MHDCSATVLHVIRKGAPGNDPKLTTCDMSGFGGFDQAPRDKCPEGVVAAMWQLPASFLQDRVHFHPGSFAELAHVMPVTAWMGNTRPGVPRRPDLATNSLLRRLPARNLNALPHRFLVPGKLRKSPDKSPASEGKQWRHMRAEEPATPKASHARVLTP
jgi:hypothetical protein